jgi:hypothetical protein
MRTPLAIIAGVLLATAGGAALGQNSSFKVSLRLLPEHVASAAPVELPTPPQAQHLPPSRDAKRLLYAGNADEARRFYASTLPQLGFYLTQEKADGATWDRSDVRVELLFYPVVGNEKATGIIVTMRPRNSLDSAASR